MRFPLLLVLSLGAPHVLSGQQPSGPPPSAPSLSLEEAQALAHRNNPTYLEVETSRRRAAAARRTAYGQLLPSVDVALTNRFQQQGEQLFNGASLGVRSDVIQSSYDVGVSYRFSAASLVAPRLESANLDAAEADVVGAAAALRAAVTRQYLDVLEAEANAALADTLVAAARGQVELARARAAVGAATALDVRRAQVELGQQEVAALNAHNAREIALLRLFEQMGVKQPSDVRLTSNLPVGAITFTLDSVLALAQRQNPVLEASRTRERVADLAVSRQRGQYLPTLTLSTGWGGYTSEYTNPDFLVQSTRSDRLMQRAACIQQDSLRRGAGMSSILAQCLAIDFTPEHESALRAANDQHPFGFTRSPWGLSAVLSFPVFDGFAREQQLQVAMLNRRDARHRVRASELRLTADVTAAYRTLVTAARTVELQTQNAAAARDELALAEERYRVGAVTFLDVVQSRASYERAESERIRAIYDYHKAFAALESAVGRPLR